MKLKETKQDRQPERLDEMVSIPVDKNLHRKLMSLAHAERRKPAQMGRILLEEAIDNRTAATA